MALLTGLPPPAPQSTMTPKLEQEGKYTSLQIFTGLRELETDQLVHFI